MRYPLSRLLLVSVLAQPQPGAAGTCTDFLRGAGHYVAEVINSGGLRLILKDAPEDKKGIYNSLVRRSVGSATRSLGFGRKEPTLPALMFASFLAWQAIDDGWNDLLDFRVEHSVTYNAAAFQDLIDFDFRFHEIKQDAESGRMSNHEALISAYWRKVSIDNYYKFRNSQTAWFPTLQDELKYLNFFGDLKGVIENGVEQKPGYDVPQAKRGPLSAEQVMRLIELNHTLYTKYQIVIEMVSDDPLFLSKLKMNPDVREAADEMTKDPFTVRVLNMKRSGAISTKQAQLILQEDAFWQTRFAEWQTIGVKKLKVAPNGNPTNTPLSLDDIRAEMLGAIS